MKKVQRVRTRRQLLRLTSVGAATFPFFALAKRRRGAQSSNNNNNNNNNNNTANRNSNNGNSCLLRGTKISTPSGERPVQELQIGDEVHTLADPKTIKWIGYNKWTSAIRSKLSTTSLPRGRKRNAYWGPRPRRPEPGFSVTWSGRLTARPLTIAVGHHVP
jgi:hypothetical protein